MQLKNVHLLHLLRPHLHPEDEEEDEDEKLVAEKHKPKVSV